VEVVLLTASLCSRSEQQAASARVLSGSICRAAVSFVATSPHAALQQGPCADLALLRCFLCLQDTVQSAFKSTGVDVDSFSKTTSVVSKTASEGVTAAKPLLSQAITFLTTTEPVGSVNAIGVHSSVQHARVTSASRL
jgi:hypothetical protein